MNMRIELITVINKNYIELGKYEEALQMVKNLWIHRCVVECLEEKIFTSKEKIKNLEKMLENS
jgi:predicted DNA-binding protein YlxM (UPF0122 family)